MTATTPARRTARGPYAKTAGVRERILDACIEAFAASGYRATTMKEVAERAQISERGLAHHFASKADLLVALLERRETRNADRMPTASGLDALAAMVDIVGSDRDKPGLVELHTIISAEATATDHPAHEHYRSRYELVRSFATLSFAALRDAGSLDSSLSDAELATAFVALCDGLQLQWLYEPESVDSVRVLHAFLRSIAAQPKDAPVAG